MLAVGFSFVLLFGVAALIWAFRTGRAVPYVRAQIVNELKDRCNLVAEFEGVVVDPLHQVVYLDTLRLRHMGGGEVLSVKWASVVMRPWPLLYGRLQIRRAHLIGLYAGLSIKDGQFERMPSCLVSTGSDGKQGLSFGIDRLQLENASLDLSVDDAKLKLPKIAVLVETVDGNTAIALKAPSIGISQGARQHALQDLDLEGHVEGLLSDPRAFVVDRFTLAGEGLKLEAKGSMDLLGPVYNLDLALEGPLSVVNRVFPEQPTTLGDFRLKAKLSGSFLDPRVSGQLWLSKAHYDDFSFGDSTELRFSADRQRVQVHRLKLVLGSGRIDGKAELALTGKLPLTADLKLTRISLGRVLTAVTVSHAWSNLEVTGKTRLSGQIKDFVLSGPFQFGIADLIVYGGGYDLSPYKGRLPPRIGTEHYDLYIPKIRLSGHWGFREDELFFKDTQLKSGETQGLLQARVGFSVAQGLRLKADFASLDLGGLGPVGGLEILGKGSAKLRMNGSYDALKADGRVDFANIEVAGIPFGQARATIRWRDLRRLDLRQIRGVLGKSRYQANLGIRFVGEVPLNLTGRITDGRIEDMFLPFKLRARDWGATQGKMKASFRLKGPARSFSGPFEATFGPLETFGERASGGYANGRLERGRIILETLALSKGGGQIYASGSLDPNRGLVDLRTQSEHLRLQDIDRIRESQPLLDGDVALQLRLKGKLSGTPKGRVSVKLDHLKAGELSLGRGLFTGPLRGRKMSLKGSLLSLGASLDGWIKIGDRMDYAAKISLDDTDLPLIASKLAGVSDVSGAVSLDAELSGGLVQWWRPSGRIQLQQASLDTAITSLRTERPSEIKLKDGVLKLSGLRVSSPMFSVKASGQLGASILDLDVDGRFDLAYAPRFLPPIEKADGRLQVKTRIEGSPQKMRLLGSGRLESRLIKWVGFDDRITGFRADLVFSQSSILLEGARGGFAGGTLGLSGAILHQGFMPENLSLRLSLKDANPRFQLSTADMTGRVSGRLRIDGPPKKLSVRGDLDIAEGRMRPKTDFQSLIGNPKLADVYDPEKEVVDMNINLAFLDPIQVKNADTDLEVGGDLQLTGTNERLGMLGSLSVSRGGQVLFFAREYTIQSGTVNLTDRYRISPRFDLKLGAEACEARIQIGLAGDFSSVETLYSSTPEMDPRDIVSCLIQGVKVSQVGDQGLSSLAGSALLKLSGVDREVRRVLQIDQIDVTSEYSSVERGYEPRVVIAKNLTLLGRPARLEYSSSLLRTSDQRAAFRFHLTQKINLQLGWTSSDDVPYGDWGLDLRERWEW